MRIEVENIGEEDANFFLVTIFQKDQIVSTGTGNFEFQARQRAEEKLNKQIELGILKID